MHEVEAGPSGLRRQRRRLFGGQIGHDDAVHTDLGGGLREGRQCELEHRVVVGQQHDRRAHVGAHGFHQLEDADQRRAAGQRALSGALDDGAVGERIGERHAQLDDVGATTLGLHHQPARGLQRGVAGGEIGDQRSLVPRAQPRERLVQAAHGALRPSALATTWTSLSPRPERPTTIVFVRGSSLASWTA